MGEPNPIIAVFRSTARTIADLENEYAALEAEVAGLRASATRAMRFQINTSAQAAEVLRETERERDEARALLRESVNLMDGRGRKNPEGNSYMLWESEWDGMRSRFVAALREEDSR